MKIIPFLVVVLRVDGFSKVFPSVLSRERVLIADFDQDSRRAFHDLADRWNDLLYRLQSLGAIIYLMTLILPCSRAEIAAITSSSKGMLLHFLDLPMPHLEG
jgi:hypothetical protein